MYFEKLRNNLFVDIDYPQHITDLIGDAQAWKEFCALPFETKKKFEFMAHFDDTGDPGYRFRSRAEGREDKEYFHIYPNTAEYIQKDGLTDLVRTDGTVAAFFDYAQQVQETAHNFALMIGKEMGKEIPELIQLVDASEIRSCLRFLHYTNDESTDIIAAQHFDRSLFTLHLYESGPGLQFLNWDMQWADAPVGEGKTVVFNGYRLEQLTKGKLQKTWHRVVRQDEVRDRISLVLFVWTDAVQDYAREARAQDLTPSYVKVVE